MGKMGIGELAVTFQKRAVYQLRRGLFTVRILVASSGHFSDRSPFHSVLLQVPFPKHFADTKWNDGVVLKQNGTMVLC